jgi:membrane-associated phospholipid phosphatase
MMAKFHFRGDKVLYQFQRTCILKDMKALLKTFDLHVTQFVLRIPESWNGFFVAITTLGDPVLTVGIGIAVAAYGVWTHAARLIIAGSLVWVTLIVGSLLKMLFGRARPMTEYAANLRVDTFSFPSGHSSGSMIAYGLLAYIAIKVLPQPYGWIAAGICALIIFLIGVSRIYLGAHFPSDVLAGWLLGGIFLTVIVLVVRPLS